jgi:hypothetical protein
MSDLESVLNNKLQPPITSKILISPDGSHPYVGYERTSAGSGGLSPLRVNLAHGVTRHGGHTMDAVKGSQTCRGGEIEPRRVTSTLKESFPDFKIILDKYGKNMRSES